MPHSFYIGWLFHRLIVSLANFRINPLADRLTAWQAYGTFQGIHLIHYPHWPHFPHSSHSKKNPPVFTGGNLLFVEPTKTRGLSWIRNSVWFFSKDWIVLLTDGSGFGFSKRRIFGFSWSGQNSLGLFHWIGFCFLGTDFKRAFNRILFF
jgi:hypothetical protein